MSAKNARLEWADTRRIRKLRQKIGDERIVTIKGVDYKFEP
ncbi:hypothetical protein NE555_17700 [Alistipes onderdonkii]|nr:hypothetical protein [Alistipes onderdonkii]MCQ4762442.1 hypothetical protein [Alistipes onderdonkii]